MAGGRDTGFQVVHYVSGLVTRNTLGIQTGVKLGDLPLGAVLMGARCICTEGWGGGRDLILSLVGGPSPVDIATLSVNVPKVVESAVTDFLQAVGAGRDVFVRLDSAPMAGGAAIVVLFYIPRLG